MAFTALNFYLFSRTFKSRMQSCCYGPLDKCKCMLEDAVKQVKALMGNIRLKSLENPNGKSTCIILLNVLLKDNINTIPHATTCM